jgi:serine/threonine-protein kinase
MIDPETIIDGRYRVISRLGSGGMADVYLAQDQLLGREVAVKVLHHHFAEDQEFVERFRREASSAAALSHPNIVGIFDRGEWNGTYYIAMEYVAGHPLKAIIRDQGALDPAYAIDIVLQILQAARVAHRRGVIHRDLKPHNVIIDEEGRARVTDFGIARAGASDMTLTGSIMGTAQYLSPEQAQGYSVSASSDLYSIGVILYELLTGAVPFEGETAVAVAFKQVSAEPRPPSELNPAIPLSLDAVVLRALAKDPAARYADADELIAALQRERENLPSATAMTSVMSTDGAANGTGAPLLAPPAAIDETQQRTPEEERDRRRKILLWSLAGAVLVAAIVLAVLLLGSSKTVAVPTVTGESEQIASATLRSAGFSPTPTPASSTTVAAGLVISQSPAGGSSASKGSHVSIIVSQGPANVALPNVSGLGASQATEKLSQAGFKPTTKSEPSQNVSSGIVIGTNPPAGTLAQVGSSVTVLLSSGPAPVKVPDVTGQLQAAAESTLTNAGLVVGTVTQKTSTEPAGTVLSQSPSSGTSLHAGESVNLTVAQASKQVAVPNLIGKSEALAGAALGEASLKPQTVKATTTEQSQVGIVLRQSPAAGTQVAKGSTVTIAVGTLGTTTTTTTPTTPTTTTSTSTTPAPSGSG